MVNFKTFKEKLLQIRNNSALFAVWFKSIIRFFIWYILNLRSEEKENDRYVWKYDTYLVSINQQSIYLGES